jgi:hypothetical protein
MEKQSLDLKAVADLTLELPIIRPLSADLIKGAQNRAIGGMVSLFDASNYRMIGFAVAAQPVRQIMPNERC